MISLERKLDMWKEDSELAVCPLSCPEIWNLPCLAPVSAWPKKTTDQHGPIMLQSC